MEIKVLEETKNKLVIEIEGEDATLCNSIRKELWNDDSVKVAASSTPHPVLKVPQLSVETTGKEPRKAILDAIERLKKQNDKLKASFVKEVK